MKSLFFVSSPLEMICAIEARDKFKTKDNILVLYLFDIDKPIVNYISSMSSVWSETHKISRSSINYGKKWVKLTNKLKREKYEYLFTSGMTFSANLLFNINYDKQFFLDDGTLTLSNVYEFHKKGNLTNKISLFPGQNKTKFKHKLNEVLHYLFGHKLRGEWNDLSLFTFFDIEETNKISVVKNELRWFENIKKEKELITDDNLVYIIGAPLIFAKIIEADYYYELLEKIASSFSTKKIIYIPHRWEPVEEIKKINKKFNFDIRNNKNIIELDFLIEGVLPKNIVGTISTALFTLKKLYPNAEVYSTSIELDKVYKNKRESINAILEYQKGMFIDV